METYLFDHTDEEKATAMNLLKAHRYWAGKRLNFNIAVGVGGALSFLFFIGTDFMLTDIVGMVVWGVIANIFYSTGYVIDSYIIARSAGERSLAGNRGLLLWVGTIAYILAGIALLMIYVFAEG